MYHFIVNEHARSKAGKSLWEQLHKTLQEKNVEHEIHVTRYQGHAMEVARDLTAAGDPMTLVVVGGDGSINDTVNGICDLSSTKLGYIPTGSGNDFARALGIHSDPKQALDNILNSTESKKINVGYVEFGATRRRFCISSGVGFDAGVCHGVAQSHIKTILNKFRLGRLSYFFVAIRQILSHERAKIKITLDGKKSYAYPKCLFAAAMNMPYEGGGYKFCPKADCGDGFLDIFIVNGIKTLNFLRFMPMAFSGKHVRLTQWVHIHRCREAVFELEDPHPVHTDGEPIAPQMFMKVGVEPEMLQVIL